MPEEAAAPKAPRKELGLDDSRSNTPQGLPPAKAQNAAASTLGESNQRLHLLFSDIINQLAGQRF